MVSRDLCCIARTVVVYIPGETGVAFAHHTAAQQLENGSFFSMKQQQAGPAVEPARMLLLLLLAPAAAFGFSALRSSSLTIASPHSERASTAAGMMRGGGNWPRSSTRRRNSRSSHQHQRGVRTMSYEGGDFPSDVGDSAGSSAVPVVLADDNPELRETMKREILSIAATSNRYVHVLQQ